MTEGEMNRGISLCRRVKELNDRLESQKSKLAKLETYIAMANETKEEDFRDIDVYVRVNHASIDFTKNWEIEELKCNASAVVCKTLASMHEEVKARIEDTSLEIQTCLNSMPGVSSENV